jgi:HAD superfamily hydrolase (TIGR01549 family)
VEHVDLDFKKTKVIIFDLWGTLLENGIFPSPARQTKKILGLFDMGFGEYIETFEKAFMTKNFSNLKEAFTNVFEEMGVDPEPYNREERLIGLWNKNKLFVKPYDDTFEVLKDLRKKYKIVLLSNSPFYTSETLEKFEFDKYMDSIHLSYDSGLLKSDKKSFELVLKEFKIKPEEALMVGDSIESDMDGAKSAGIPGILIDRRDKRSFKNKVLSLTELRNKILKGD